MHRLLRSLTFTALAAIAVLSGPALADETARVEGSVVDRRTLLPVAATVTLKDSTRRVVTVATDRAGRYAAIGLESGPIEIVIHAKRFQDLTVSCDVPPDSTGRLDAPLDRALDVISLSGVPRHISSACTLEPATADVYIIR